MTPAPQPATPSTFGKPAVDRLAKAAAGVIAAIVLLAGALQLTRPGYSVDEEFTVFAVRGIQAHGVPLLPSGLLYDRGLAYSYASWVAGAVAGSELPAYRALSLACAALSVWLTFLLVARSSPVNAALVASLLVTTSVPFWATATSGRFYAPFLAAFLAVQLALSTLRTTCTPRTVGTIVVLSAFARWTHELAFLCAAVPAFFWVTSRGDRRRSLLGTIAVGAGLLAAQSVMFALHYFAPSSGETMVRRFFLWQVLNLFERPADRQFMIPIVVMAIAWIVAPARARLVSVIALSLSAMTLTYSLARATNSAPLSRQLVEAILFEGSRYPLDMLWHIARTTPLTLSLAIVALVTRISGLGGTWPRRERILHLLWIGWVLWFGVIDSGITTNYLLLPVSFMLMAIAVDAYAVLIAPDAPARRYFSVPKRVAVAAVIALAAQIALDQWRGADSMTARLEGARPTIHAPEIAGIRDGLQPSDRVVCTDELGCLMLIGRIDRWLALDDFVRERFLVRRGDAPVSGVYTGVPAAFRPADLFAPNPDGTFPGRILIVDIFKDYPIGNSRSWLPRAIEEDGLPVVPLVETPQMRAIEVLLPERAALLR